MNKMYNMNYLITKNKVKTVALILALASPLANATTPSVLLCKIAGDSYFTIDEQTGSEILTFDDDTDWADKESTVRLFFKKGYVAYSQNDTLQKEDLVKVADRIYLGQGRDEDKKEDFFGAYTFSKDYTKASYSTDGNSTIFFLCKTLEK